MESIQTCQLKQVCCSMSGLPILLPEIYPLHAHACGQVNQIQGKKVFSTSLLYINNLGKTALLCESVHTGRRVGGDAGAGPKGK